MFPKAILLAVAAQVFMQTVYFNGPARLSPADWLRSVVLPFCSVAVVSIGSAALAAGLMAPSPWRLLAVTGVSTAATVAAIVALGMSGAERQRVRLAALGLMRWLRLG